MVSVDTLLTSLGTVFVTIRGHDSGCTSYGVSDGRRRWFVKAAYGADIAQLRSAARFHGAVHHPSIVPLVDVREIAGGLAVVYPWVAGEVLNDPYVAGALPRDSAESALSRFRRLPVNTIVGVLDTIFDAHVEVAGRGFVAVDFYDGCILHDFATDVVRLVDLDLYRPGPYTLDADRQFGSARFMAPEEWERGASIDERTTVFTLGRTARVLLGEEDGGWRGSAALADVAERATKSRAADRYPSVTKLLAAWRGAG